MRSEYFFGALVKTNNKKNQTKFFLDHVIIKVLCGVFIENIVIFISWGKNFISWENTWEHVHRDSLHGWQTVL